MPIDLLFLWEYGTSIGTDGEAQGVELILREVEMEVMGPVGLVRG